MNTRAPSRTFVSARYFAAGEPSRSNLATESEFLRGAYAGVRLSENSETVCIASSGFWLPNGEDRADVTIVTGLIDRDEVSNLTPASWVALGAGPQWNPRADENCSVVLNQTCCFTYGFTEVFSLVDWDRSAEDGGTCRLVSRVWQW